MAAATAWLALSVDASVCTAQAPSTGLVILRAGDEADAALVRDIDQALLEALEASNEAPDASFSPVPFEEAKLVTGCDGTTLQCVPRVAAALDRKWLLVREIVREQSGAVRLMLVAEDGAFAVTPRHMAASVPRRGGPSAQIAVRNLVRAMYPERSVETPTVEDPVPRASLDRDVMDPWLRGIGWTSFIGGAALLTTGVAFGVMSDRAHAESERLTIRTADDVDESQRWLARSRDRADTANTCFIAGSAFALGGVGLLLWDALRGRRDASHALQVGAAPSLDGGLVQLSGVLERRH